MTSLYSAEEEKDLKEPEDPLVQKVGRMWKSENTNNDEINTAS